MMFVVITKEITAYKSDKVVLSLGAGMISIIVFPMVRHPGPEIEKLQGTEQRRQNPKH